jgi:hypothetical protein
VDPRPGWWNEAALPAADLALLEAFRKSRGQGGDTT